MRIYLSFLILLFMSKGFAQNDKEWELYKTRKEIEVFKRKTDEGFDAVRIKATIHSTMPTFLHVINDADNYTDWVYGCSESKLLLFEGDTVEYSTLTDMPFPVWDRYLEVTSTQEIKDGIWVAESTVREGAPEIKGVVNIDYFLSKWVVRDKGNKVLIDYEVSTEPGGSIPAWLYNLAVSRGPLKTMQSLKEVLEHRN